MGKSMETKESDYGQQYKEYITQAAGDKAYYSRRSGARWRALVQLSAVPQPVCKAASVLPVFVSMAVITAVRELKSTKSSFLPYVARIVFDSALSFSSGIFEIFE